MEFDSSEQAAQLNPQPLGRIDRSPLLRMKRESPPLWTGRSLLSRSLAASLGAIVGGALTLSLFFLTETSIWLFYLPIPVSALAGFWKGDRALYGIMRFLR